MWGDSGSSSLARVAEPLGHLELWSSVGYVLLHCRLPGKCGMGDPLSAASGKPVHSSVAKPHQGNSQGASGE